MANHKSALKRIRQSEVRRERNRYQHKTVRTMIKRLRALESQKEADKLAPEVFSLIDKCVKKSIFHKNKASNLKSKLTKHIAKLA